MLKLKKKKVQIGIVPFNIYVTHFFASDAGFIQNDISCVPNNGPQEVPV